MARVRSIMRNSWRLLRLIGDEFRLFSNTCRGVRGGGRRSQGGGSGPGDSWRGGDEGRCLPLLGDGEESREHREVQRGLLGDDYLREEKRRGHIGGRNSDDSFH